MRIDLRSRCGSFLTGARSLEDFQCSVFGRFCGGFLHIAFEVVHRTGARFGIHRSFGSSGEVFRVFGKALSRGGFIKTLLSERFLIVIRTSGVCCSGVLRCPVKLVDRSHQLRKVAVAQGFGTARR